jgi:hypothetical protein
MHRVVKLAIGLALGLNVLASNASAQWGYPRGYRTYGMSQWGADPASGYMAGLGSYARGQGVYQVEKAKAGSINVDTMVNWNQALRARQAALREDKRKKVIKRDIERRIRVDELDLKDGTTLSNLLYQILDSDPAAVKSGRARAALSPSALREIPFEWDSEAVTSCIDQMTGTESIPGLLMDPKYLDERNALRAAVVPALEEDAKGTVSMATTKRIDEAVARSRPTSSRTPLPSSRATRIRSITSEQWPV